MMDLPIKIFIFAILFCNFSNGQEEYPCDSDIYCYGELLHTIALAGLDTDEKTLVDRKMRFTRDEIWANFTLLNEETNGEPPRESIRKFIADNFDEGNQFVDWIPSDFVTSPEFLNGISDLNLRTFAKEINEKWIDLGRKIIDDVKENGDMYSMIWVDNPTIVPGGRFKEFYYWDSYWTFKGLIHSEMLDTMKGMLENFMQMVRELGGYVPNGGRIYFKRSQPPLLIPMVKQYYDSTKDLEFIRTHIDTMVQEFQWWENNRMHNIESPSGESYRMLRYNVEIDGPRPETYRGDFILAQSFANPTEKKEFYYNMKSGAESGLDYSSRWFLPEVENEIGHLIDTKTRNFIPVDLNSYYYLGAKYLAEFYGLIENEEQQAVYNGIANNLEKNINDILWNAEEGVWHDYIFDDKVHKKEFYPTNLAPLFAGIAPPDLQLFKSYVDKIEEFRLPGGVATSDKNHRTGEQWDYPNGWAPLQDLVVVALENSNDKELQELAFEIANNWVLTTYETYYNPEFNKTMFEKYDVTQRGNPGAGGEYRVVQGFGWTNGVVLDFLNKYGHRMTTNTTTTTTSTTDTTTTATDITTTATDTTTTDTIIPTSTDSSANAIFQKFNFFALFLTFLVANSRI